MNNAKKHLGKRVLAIFLSLLIILSMAPINVFATMVTDNDTPVETVGMFTVLVTDGKNPISGAVVTLKNDDEHLDDTGTTDSEGKAEFLSVAALESDYEGDPSEFVCKYTVVADGYDLASGEFCPADEGGWAGEKVIELKKTVHSIPDADYNITTYNGFYDAEEHYAVDVEAEGYTVEYKNGDEDYSEEVPVIKNAGEYIVSIKISKDGYEDKVIESKSVIMKSDREFGFSIKDPENLVYNSEGVEFLNIASSEEEPGDVVYTVNDESIADIDAETGKLTFKKIGIVEVTATMAESDNYNESVAKYRVTLVAADRTFGFTNNSPDDITYNPKKDIFSNVAVNNEGVGEITYSIVSQYRDGKEVTDVAEIDAENGDVRIKASGTIVVKATVEAAGNYKGAEDTYTLTINRAVQRLYFTGGGIADLAYNSTCKNELGGGLSEGKITYNVIEENITAGEKVVTIDEDGNITAVGIGSANIKATKAGDSRYEAATAYCEVTTVKAQQKDFTLGEDTAVYYGTKDTTIVAEGNPTESDVVYSLIFPENTEAFAKVDEETGKITFDDKKTGKFTLKAENAGDSFYEPGECSCRVTVEEKDFSIYANIYGTQGTNGWYISGVEIVPQEGFKIGYNNSFGDAEWNDSISISEEGITGSFAYYLKETETGYISKAIESPIIKIDETNPTLRISYSNPATTLFGSLIYKLFFKDKVTVTLTSEDAVSGIEKFVYSIDGSEVIEVTDGISYDEGTKKYSVKFEIGANYNGKVTANAIDYAGLKAAGDNLIGDDNDTELVVDNVAPNVTVAFEETETGYYNKATEATITVVEKNFYPEDVEVTIRRRYNNESKYKNIVVELSFLETKENTHVAKIPFNENADYKFDISYTDKSGNEFDKFDEVGFTVDMIAPLIELSYADEDKLDNYNQNRTAIIKINEHNFDPEGLVFDLVGHITEEDGTISSVELADYQEQLRKAEWTSEGDLHTASVEISEEARYHLTLSYTDLAGNRSSVINDDFIIDKTAPEKLNIEYGEPLNMFEEWFYGDEVTVTISAYDPVSGVDSFNYSYSVSDGVSSRNEEKTNVTVTDKDIENGSYTFSIPAQFRGKVSFSSKDKTANISEVKNGDKVIIVDNIAPGVWVEFNNTDAQNGIYYKKDRIATIIINEANFWSSDVNVFVNGVEEQLSFGQKLDLDNSYPEDTYVAERVFDEDGDYELDILYEDRSNNKGECSTGLFVIDQTAPTVSIDYDNNRFENEKYFDDNRKAKITVNEHNFDPAGINFELSAVITESDGTVKEVVSEDNYISYLRNIENWKSEGDIHTIELPVFDTDARYTIDLSFTDLAGNESNEEHDEFVIDKEKATELKIEYSEARNVVENWLFYRNNVKVTVSAFDGVSGIRTLGGTYAIADEVSDVNEGDSYSYDFENDTYVASYTFEIPPQYRGSVSLKAIDFAGNSAEIKDEKVLVVDNVAPNVSVEIKNNEALNDKYYKADRYAEVTVTEANFWSEDVELIVYRQLDTESDYTLLDETYEFDKAEGKADTYKAVVPFDENADYKFSIVYTDRSGNEYVYDEIEFVVDKIAPDIALSYTNDSVPSNGNNHNTNRKPVITVIEHNFDPKDLEFEMQGVVTDDNGNEVTVVTEENGYLDYLQNIENWNKSEGDVYTIDFSLDVDARYTINKLFYTDLAGNESAVITDEFVIDKNVPSDLEIVYEDTKWYEDALTRLTFGFYNPETTVILKAEDNVSGLDYFTYSYTLGGKAALENNGVVDAKGFPDENGELVITIPAQFRGFVSFSATDKANNTSEVLRGDKVVVVDSVFPKVNVEFDNNNVANGKYYKADRKATITVEEANFWEEDIVIIKGTRTDDLSNIDGVYEEVRETPEFIPDSNNPGIYVATVTFEDNADYTLDISYTDKAGNNAILVYNQGRDEYAFEKQEFTVDKIAPEISIEFAEDTALNENQYKANRTATITVKEHNFDAKYIDCQFDSKNKVGGDIDISSKDYENYLKNNENWTSNGNVHTITIDFDIDAQYDFEIGYTDLAGNEVAEKISEEFGVDKVKPDDLSIAYKETMLSVFLRAITFNYYKDSVIVTLTARDETSGVDYFTYSYVVDEDASKVNDGMEDQKIVSEDIERSNYSESGYEKYEKATATFEIPAQFRGKVSFTATDRAGNESETFKDESSTIIVDNIAPVVIVEYDNTTENDHYKERTATITVKEENFWAEDVKVTIKRRLDTEKEFSVIDDYTPEFKPVKGVADTYAAVIEYNELNSNAEYIFDIDYTDRSGNAAEYYLIEDNVSTDCLKDYVPDEFTVDVTYPEIAISYDNNDVRYENKFKADRTATIVITEHNFVPDDVETEVTAKNLERKDVEVENYSEYLKKADSWTSEGDTHTAVIKFTEEADYTFEIEYTDPAGNSNQGIIKYAEGTEAPEEFTVDKTVPVSAITVGSWTESKNGAKWDHFLNDISFSLWANKTINVKVESSDELSGLGTVEHFRSSEALTLAQVKASTEWIAVENNKSEFSYDIEPDERFVIYVHVVDKAGNEKYLSSDGIIVDKTLPDVEAIAPEVTVEPQNQPVSGIYTTDVKVDLTVTDPVNGTVYSGLKSITYEIFNNSVSVEKPTQEGTLFTYDITAKEQSDLVQKYDEKACITIDSKKNNSNDVTIRITAIDNSDNITVKTHDVKIDITAPVIDISYDNNNAEMDKFFNNNRTATIIVTERNFVAEDVKIDITNTDGKMPVISDWNKVSGTGNLDDTKWIRTISYVADGDYTFGISYTDMAGLLCKQINYAEGTVAANTFTVDKTRPVVTVTYDNNNVFNGRYYDAQRTATIVVDEHNFKADRVSIVISATDDGKKISKPQITKWVSDGDKRTCQIYYNDDAMYIFDISVMDKAGNVSKKYRTDTFFVDKTDPVIDITNIEDNSANSGKVAPIIKISDTNFDIKNVKITLTGANRGALSLNSMGGYNHIHNGTVFSFNNFAVEKSVDDIYTISVSITDNAGRTTSKSVSFSVNRFGSVYTLGDALSELINKFKTKTEDIEITEVNPNKLDNIKLTLFKNSETIVLEEGVDFEVKAVGGNGKWYKYVYTIFKDNFVDDGVYSLSLHSEDSAGNVAENTLDTKDAEVNFGIDKTAPTINIKNLNSNETYALDSLKVNLSSLDNLSLKSVSVELDGKKCAEWSGDDLKALIASGSDMSFDISGDSTTAHSIKVIAIDEAGNEQVEEINDFYVTTNLWVRYYTNEPLFYGSIAAVILAAGIAVFFVVKKRKKNEEKK